MFLLETYKITFMEGRFFCASEHIMSLHGLDKNLSWICFRLGEEKQG